MARHRLVPILIDLPVEGELITPNTPGTRVPSHGTTLFGEAYAIDFVVVQKGRPHGKSLLESLVLGLPLEDFFGWGQPVFNVLGGEVVGVEGSVEERNPVNLFQDVSHMLKVTKSFSRNPGDLGSVAGNHVLVKHSEALFSLYAHLQAGSIAVRLGQSLEPGDRVGCLGHSGNSTMPHLHFQLMDSHDVRQARGVPFLFRRYQVREGRGWKTRENTVPRKGVVIRSSRTPGTQEPWG